MEIHMLLHLLMYSVSLLFFMRRRGCGCGVIVLALALALALAFGSLRSAQIALIRAIRMVVVVRRVAYDHVKGSLLFQLVD